MLLHSHRTHLVLHFIACCTVSPMCENVSRTYRSVLMLTHNTHTDFTVHTCPPPLSPPPADILAVHLYIHMYVYLYIGLCMCVYVERPGAVDPNVCQPENYSFVAVVLSLSLSVAAVLIVAEAAAAAVVVGVCRRHAKTQNEINLYYLCLCLCCVAYYTYDTENLRHHLHGGASEAQRRRSS